MLPLLAAGLVAGAHGARSRSAPDGRLLLVERPMVLRLSGEVWLARRGTGQSHPVTDTAALAADDRLSTGPDGYAVVTWPEGATLSVAPRSAVQFLGIGAERLLVSLDDGEVWLHAGETASERGAVVLGAEGVRAEGARLQARRTANGALEILTYDRPAWLTSGGYTQLVPRGAQSQAASGYVPSLPRPLPRPRAVALQIIGAGAWAVVDEAGRTTGRPPGGVWVGSIPGSGRPSGEGNPTAVFLPLRGRAIQIVLWGEETSRRAEIVAWPTDWDAAVQDHVARPPENALRVSVELGASTLTTLTLSLGDAALALMGPPKQGTTLPPGVRLPVASGKRAGPVPSLLGSPATALPPTPSPEPAPSSTPGALAAPTDEPSVEPTARAAAAHPSPAPTRIPMQPEAPVPALPTADATADETATAPTAPPSATAEAKPARFERAAANFAPPSPVPTAMPSPTLAPAALLPTSVPLASPMRAVATNVPTLPPTRPPITVVVPTLPPTPLPTLPPPTVAARPTAVAATGRLPSPVVPGAPPSGAPPGGLGINAWGGLSGLGAGPSTAGPPSSHATTATGVSSSGSRTGGQPSASGHATGGTVRP
ncbi:MAG: hypothetical protein IRZ14_06900 [Chloroflexi bacterium]|nr:hypothetical protein [Chloroflexota bacterium]